MNSDLEAAIVNALRAKADTAPTPPMPPLGSRAGARRGRLVLVAAAALVVVAVAVGAVLVAVVPRRDGAPVAPPVATSPQKTASEETGLAPGEVYYLLRLTDLGAGGVIREQQVWQPPERAGEWRQTVVQGTVIENGRVVPGGGAVGGTVAVIFDADDRYLGSPKEAVRHGVAPGLGEPPSRMLD